VFIGFERRLLEARGSQLEALVFRPWDNAVAARVVCETLRIQIR
jgi:phage baseplate assembly protein W